MLSGTGDAARFLARYARPGRRSVGPRRSSPAAAAPWTPPRRTWSAAARACSRAGRIRIRNRTERAALSARGPRTLAGVRADGTILLVTVDGRQPRWSRGATLLESARLLRSLGARNGMALDGGGSTTMVVGSRVLGRPSDGSQRPVSDALVVTR